MSVSLQPGANLALPPTSALLIDIRWAPERPEGREVDASAFLLDSGGRVGTDEDFIFYNNPCAFDGALMLTETADAARRLRIELARLPARVGRIAICLTLHGGGSLARATRLELTLSDAGGAPLVSFAPDTAGLREAALILGEVYRHQAVWKFRAVAQGFTGGLGPLARHFGVDIADEPPETAPPSAAAASAPPAAARPASPGAPADPASTRPPAIPRPASQDAPAPSRAGAGASSGSGARLPPTLAKAPPTGALPTGSARQHSAAAGLDYEILYPGLYALARVELPAGRQLRAQSDAMLAMSPTVAVESRMQGGLLGGLGRLVSGESLFLQTLTAARGAGSVYLAPTTPGDIAALEVRPGDGLVIQKGGFLVCSEEVEVTTKLQNLAEGFFSGEGFFILKAEGRGLVLLESFGAIHRLDLRAGEQKIVDNGHLVAWSQSMDYDLELGSRGLLSSFTSGEGIVCRFRGPGTLLIQSRQPLHFGQWAAQLLPQR